MSARDVASREHHHHQGGADRQRRNHRRAGADHRAADCQNKEESSNEFRDVLVHATVLTENISSNQATNRDSLYGVTKRRFRLCLRRSKLSSARMKFLAARIFILLVGLTASAFAGNSV